MACICVRLCKYLLQNSTIQGISGTGSLRIGAAFFVSLTNELKFIWTVFTCFGYMVKTIVIFV